MPKNEIRIKRSYYLPKTVSDAMEVVRETEKILPSFQVELALKMYLSTKHGELIKKSGIKI